MSKNRVLSTYFVKTGNIANTTVASIDVINPITDNLLHYTFIHYAEFDFGLINGDTSIDKTVYEDWGTIE